VEQDQRTPLEKRIDRSLEDDSGQGKPLSRRARQTQRTVEAYLQAGGMPRYMERLREIDHGIAAQRRALAAAYRALKAECGDDPDQFARRWTARVARWRFDELNDLIHEHNKWYPVERNLPLDPRTRDYVKLRGRPYWRPVLGPAWVLEQFPVRGQVPQ
jgi:hypothetical protein